MLLLTWPRFNPWSGIPQALHTAPPTAKKEKKKSNGYKKYLHFLIFCALIIYSYFIMLLKTTFSFPSTQYQFSSVAQSCPTLCDPMNRSTPGLPVHHQLPEFTQIHVHRVSDAIQPSHPLSSPSPPAPNPSQHQSLFQ